MIRAVIHGDPRPQHSYSSYSLLGRAVSQPFLTVSGPILGTAIWAILGPATGWPSTKKYFGLGHGTGHDHAPHYGRGGWRKLWAAVFSASRFWAVFSRISRIFTKKTGLKRLRNGFSARNAYTNACWETPGPAPTPTQDPCIKLGSRG
mgnify:CR=1 FL=1